MGMFVSHVDGRDDAHMYTSFVSGWLLNNVI